MASNAAPTVLTNGTKDCRWCGFQIPISALICKECGSYQSRWRGYIAYAAGSAGLLALVGSAIAFIASNWTTTRQHFFWIDKAKLVDVEYYPNINEVNGTIFNVGDGPIFVSDIGVNWRNQSAFDQIQEDVKVDQVTILRLSAPVTSSSSSIVMRTVVATASGKPSVKLLSSSGFDSFKYCFVTEFMFSQNDFIANMNSFYGREGLKVVTDPAEIILHYYSDRNGQEVAQKYPAVAIFGGTKIGMQL